MLHGGQPSQALLPPVIAAAVDVPAGRRHGPLGGRCAVSPICPFIRPQKLPMHALSQQQARLDMDCRIPGSLGLSRQARAAWWAPRSEHAQMSSGRSSPLSWSYVSSTSLSSIEMEHLWASSTSVWQSRIPDMQTKPSSMHGRQVMSAETALRGAPRLKSLSTALGATLGSPSWPLPVLADRAAGPPALPLPHDAELPHDALHLPAAQSAGRRA